MKVFQPGQRLLTTDEAAAYLTVRKEFLLSQCRAGQIEYLRDFGREYRFTPEQLDAWLVSRVVEPTVARNMRIVPQGRRVAR